MEVKWRSSENFSLKELYSVEDMAKVITAWNNYLSTGDYGEHSRLQRFNLANHFSHIAQKSIGVGDGKRFSFNEELKLFLCMFENIQEIISYKKDLTPGIIFYKFFYTVLPYFLSGLSLNEDNIERTIRTYGDSDRRGIAAIAAKEEMVGLKVKFEDLNANFENGDFMAVGSVSAARKDLLNRYAKSDLRPGHKVFISDAVGRNMDLMSDSTSPIGEFYQNLFNNFKKRFGANWNDFIKYLIDDITALVATKISHENPKFPRVPIDNNKLKKEYLFVFGESINESQLGPDATSLAKKIGSELLVMYMRYIEYYRPVVSNSDLLDTNHYHNFVDQDMIQLGPVLAHLSGNSELDKSVHRPLDKWMNVSDEAFNMSLREFYKDFIDQYLKSGAYTTVSIVESFRNNSDIAQKFGFDITDSYDMKIYIQILKEVNKYIKSILNNSSDGNSYMRDRLLQQLSTHKVRDVMSVGLQPDNIFISENLTGNTIQQNWEMLRDASSFEQRKVRYFLRRRVKRKMEDIAGKIGTPSLEKIAEG